MATEHFTQCGCPCQGVTVQKVLAAEMPLELKKKKKEINRDHEERSRLSQRHLGSAF